MNNKIKKISKNTLVMASLPVVVYLFFSVLCSVKGIEGFGVGTDLVVMLRTTIYTGMIALAVSYNLTSGRFDFSVGSVLVLSTIIGVNTAVKLGLGPIGMLTICMICGAVLGCISGITYVILRLPPMVVSLGIAMIYEAIAFNLNGGKGAKLIGNNVMLIFAKQPYIYILCAVVLAALIIILNFTKFGYNTNSLRGGQIIAVNVGVDEKKNTVICYIIAGVLMAIAGVISISILGSIPPKLGLGSAEYMMNAFLPMFIGGALAKYADRNLGVLVGSLVQAIITSGFSRLGLSTSWQSVLNGIIILAFLAFTIHSYKLIEFKVLKEKRIKAERAIAVEQ